MEGYKRPCLILLAPDTLLLKAYIEGAVQQLLVVCAAVKHQRKAHRRGNAATGGVQGQLTHWNTHSLQRTQGYSLTVDSKLYVVPAKRLPVQTVWEVELLHCW